MSKIFYQHKICNLINAIIFTKQITLTLETIQSKFNIVYISGLLVAYGPTCIHIDRLTGRLPKLDTLLLFSNFALKLNQKVSYFEVTIRAAPN